MRDATIARRIRALEAFDATGLLTRVEVLENQIRALEGALNSPERAVLPPSGSESDGSD